MITKLYIKNFGPIKEITIDCKDKDVFITGENGSGKTHVLQAISLALTGKVAKTIKIADFVGKYDKDFLIKLEMKDGTKIERQKAKAKLVLKNGKVFDKINDVYSYVPFDPDLFYNLSYVKQGQISEFFEGDRNLMDKLVNLIVDMKKLDNGYTIVTKTLNSKLKEIENLENNKIEKPDIDKNVLLQEISTLENKIQNINHNEIQEQEKLIEELEKAKYKKINIEETLKNMTEKEKPEISISEAKEYMENNRIYEENKKTQEEFLEKESHCIDFKENALEAFKRIVEIDTDIIKSNFSQEELEDITNTKHLILDYFTTEKHVEDESEVDGLIKFIKTKWNIDSETILKAKNIHAKYSKILASKKDEWSEIIMYLKGNNATADTAEAILNDYIEKIRKQIKTIKENIEKLKDKIKINSDEFFDISSRWSAYDAYLMNKKANETELEELSKRIKILNNKIKYTKEYIQELKNMAYQNEMIKNTIEDKKRLIAMYENWEKQEEKRINQIKEMNKEKDYLVELKECLKILPSGIRHILFTPIADIVNEDFFEIFSFSNLGPISIDWEKIQLNIGDMSYDQISGAQSVTLALSLRLALLKRMGTVVPLMLIDEPTNHLDSKRIFDLTKYFSLLQKRTQMFVSTHNIDIIPSLNTVTININDYK